jgi:endogenous inhibitor of DNA gyrase (YacG/DUF329 family)
MTNTLRDKRPCDTCGQPFTIPTRNPRKRFCSPPCRTADWHIRNRTKPTNANDVHPSTDAVPNAVQTANGVQRCPNCHHELAIIAVLVPPAAANVRLPEVTMTSPT